MHNEGSEISHDESQQTLKLWQSGQFIKTDHSNVSIALSDISSNVLITFGYILDILTF